MGTSLQQWGGFFIAVSLRLCFIQALLFWLLRVLAQCCTPAVRRAGGFGQLGRC